MGHYKRWLIASEENPVTDAHGEPRNIPADVKRNVRQRCGFGCIFCGSPVFQYDHLVDFAEVREHDPNNINLLCPNHHIQKTAGRLSRAAVALRAADPVNKSVDRSVTGMPLEITGDSVSFRLGSNLFRNSRQSWGGEFHPLVVEDREAISARWSEGWLSIDMRLTDEFGAPLLTIEDGELTVSTRQWDFEMIGRTITLRAGPGRITTKLSIEADGITVSRGLFAHRRTAVVVTPDACRVGSFVRNVGAIAFVERALVTRGTISETYRGLVC
jgi:hypothetical protein